MTYGGSGRGRRGRNHYGAEVGECMGEWASGNRATPLQRVSARLGN